MAYEKKGVHPEVTDLRLLAQICRMIESGVHPATAARAHGLAAQTFYEWLRRGRDAEDGPYHHFFTEVDKADACAEVTMVSRFAEATEHEWKAAADYVAKRWPDNWANKSKTTIDARTEVVLPESPAQLIQKPEVIEAITAQYYQKALNEPSRPASEEELTNDTGP